MSARVWTGGYGPDDFLVVNLSHHTTKADFITFWRTGDAGYAYPLAWAGVYPRQSVEAHLGYYNSGHSNIAIQAGSVASLLVAPGPRMIDGGVGPVVLNTKENWTQILKAKICPVVTIPPSRLCNSRISPDVWRPWAEPESEQNRPSARLRLEVERYL